MEGAATLQPRYLSLHTNKQPFHTEELDQANMAQGLPGGPLLRHFEEIQAAGLLGCPSWSPRDPWQWWARHRGVQALLSGPLACCWARRMQGVLLELDHPILYT